MGCGKHQFFSFFAPNLHPSISVPPSVCFSVFYQLHFYRLQDLRLFVLIWQILADETVGTEEICNSLSVFLSPYLSANVFHLGFSISMSLQSLGCQTQLRGHYWQFRAWLSVRVSLIFLLSGRSKRGVRVYCPWSTWTLIFCISKPPIQHWKLNT